MENKSTILNELREISPVVAAISNQAPYSVPDGYFEELPGQLKLRIGIELNSIEDPNLSIGKAPTYQLPEGYFDGLAGSILNRIRANESAHPKDELELLSPLLAGLNKKNPFTPPAGYFEDLSGNVLSGVQAIEFVNEALENLSPMMMSLKDKNVYSVPPDYFESFPAEMIAKLNQQPARVVSIGFGKKMFRYAAAAVLAGAILFGGYKILNPSGKTQDIATVSEADLEMFLNSTTIPLADTSTIAPAPINEDNGKDLLADVSDDELQQYLEQHGGAASTYTN
jgi:hypothetical protein